MRILIDEEDLRWDAAWGIVTNVFFYTNHTVLPVCFMFTFWWRKMPTISSRRLLKNGLSLWWSLFCRGSLLVSLVLNLVDQVVNRHMQIIYDIVCGLPWIVRETDINITLTESVCRFRDAADCLTDTYVLVRFFLQGKPSRWLKVQAPMNVHFFSCREKIPRWSRQAFEDVLDRRQVVK